ncbi:hypothetical protein Hte_012573 [Hypoxylon texense]
MADEFTISQAEQRATAMVKRIWDNYSALQDILRPHERTIQRRWTKWNERKREMALQSAWGEPIPLEHRPDVALMRYQWIKLKGRTVDPDPRKRSHFMWPNINKEDLLKTEPLLLMLNARGRNPPSIFASADRLSIQFGVGCKAFQATGYTVAPVSKWNMKFSGRDTPDSYAKLVSWEDDEDENPERRRRLHQDFHPVPGLWVLEIQARVYQFLVDMCKLILHDLPTDTNSLRTLATEPEPPLPTANAEGDAGATSLMVSSYEATYHLPARIDIRRLQDLVEAKFAESEDVLMALCEDPGFFIYKALEMYEHRPEHLLDSDGERLTALALPGAPEMLIKDSIEHMLRYHMSDVELWRISLERVKQFADSIMKYSKNDEIELDPESGNPTDLDLEYSYCSLLSHLSTHIQKETKIAGIALKGSPLFRRRARAEADGNGSFKVSIDFDKLTEREGQIVFAFHNMVMPVDRRAMDIHVSVEQFERAAQTNEGRELVTSFLAQQFSGISIMTECLRQMQLFQPYHNLFQLSFRSRDGWENESAKISARSHEVVSPLWNFRLSETAKKIGTALTKMKYPVDKQPSRKKVDDMRAAEKVLASFWDEVFSQLREKGLVRSRIKVLYETRQPEQTPEWTEPLKAKRQGSSSTSTPKIPGSTYADQREDQTGKFTPAHTKVKVKTRPSQPAATAENRDNGDNGDNRGNRDNDGDPSDTTSEGPKLSDQVDKRTSKVVSALWVVEGGSQVPGQIPWTEFLHAMYRIGFGVEKLPASIWQFTPGPTIVGHLTAARPIIFHQPHPETSHSLLIMRRVGKRLEKSMAWKPRCSVGRGIS